MISVRLACFRYRTQIFLSAPTTAIVDMGKVENSLEQFDFQKSKYEYSELLVNVSVCELELVILCRASRPCATRQTATRFRNI